MPKDAVHTLSSASPAFRRERHDEDNAVASSSSSKEVSEARGPGTMERRVSVRDLASKFDKVQASSRGSAAKGKPNESAGKFDIVQGTSSRVGTTMEDLNDPKLLQRDAQFNKLTGVLQDLQARVSGLSKNDVEEALNITKMLSVICTQQEAELAEERAEIKKVFRLVQQYAGDARHIMEEAHAAAEREIGAVKEIAANIRDAFQEQKETLAVNGMDLEEIRREAHEARMIRMLHATSKPVDMENQIKSLRQQLLEKTAESAALRKELDTLKLYQHDGGRLQWYRLTGLEQLGATLTIEPLDDTVCDLSRCSIQWYRLSPDGSGIQIVTGAIRPQYAPEPFDVGRKLRAGISVPYGKTLDVQTTGPIQTAPGLDNYVDMLISKGGAQFNARIILKNGEMVKKQSLHTFDVNKTRIKLHNTHSVKARENYSSSMQLCGVRGGGDSAAQGLFWEVGKGMTFILVLESERERNAAVLLARKFAKSNKIFLGGPDDVMRSEG